VATTESGLGLEEKEKPHELTREEFQAAKQAAMNARETQSYDGKASGGGTAEDRDKQIEELNQWNTKFDAEHPREEHPYEEDGVEVRDLTSPDAEPTQIEGPCQSLAQDAKQVPKNVNGPGHNAGPSGVEILDAFESCVTHVMKKMKPDLRTKTVAVQNANKEYLDAFNHIFYHLKRLKESELSEVFEKTHTKVWGALEQEATGLEDTLKGMKLDKHNEERESTNLRPFDQWTDNSPEEPESTNLKPFDQWADNSPHH
jgi:hypothetical protein